MKKIIISTLAVMVVTLSSYAQELQISKGSQKVAAVMTYIENMYVDTVDEDKLSEDAIKSILKTLDPHSSYVSAKEVKEMNEPLEGNFDGIGIVFNINTDTLYVVEVIAGGPSEKVGIMPGDRIILVNDTLIAGEKKTTKYIMSRLRGEKGTKVNVKVKRRGFDELLNFNITRDKIPIYSLDASFMVNPTVGYIRLSRFGATTVDEFKEACKNLKKEGMQDLILDLEGNGGGYLVTAIEMANEFLKGKQLIVYTEGTNQPRQIAMATNKGLMKNGKLVILIDETSASASEIVSGAVQDWDRGVVVGRRSFGKGLVQRQIDLFDGSVIRLTTARYYTPTGRCIQKPYTDGEGDSYAKDVIERYNRGEMMSADSIHFPDSLKYKTLVNKRTVYGGGGVMPDYFVPVDTAHYSAYHRNLVYSGAIYKTVLSEVDINRKTLLSEYPTIEAFANSYTVSDVVLASLRSIGEAEKVEYNEEEFEKSKTIIETQIKALMARDLYDSGSYFRIMNEHNETFKKGVEIISSDFLYNSLLTRDRK